jgi:hypothetical protein
MHSVHSPRAKIGSGFVFVKISYYTVRDASLEVYCTFGRDKITDVETFSFR